MTIELNTEEAQLLAQAIKHYISNLREEIAKTEKHKWSETLHREELTLQAILKKLG